VLTSSRKVKECKPLGYGGLVCLVCAFITIAWAPAATTTPWALEAVKAVTVTAVIGCVALADTATADSAPTLKRPDLFVVRPGRYCPPPTSSNAF